MVEDNRFVVMADTDLEISIKDNLTKDYCFSIVCESIDEFEVLLIEVMNITSLLNKLWEPTKRFEEYNKKLLMNSMEFLSSSHFKEDKSDELKIKSNSNNKERFEIIKNIGIIDNHTGELLLTLTDCCRVLNKLKIL